jgi:hypothetical protein
VIDGSPEAVFVGAEAGGVVPARPETGKSVELSINTQFSDIGCGPSFTIDFENLRNRGLVGRGSIGAEFTGARGPVKEGDQALGRAAHLNIKLIRHLYPPYVSKNIAYERHTCKYCAASDDNLNAWVRSEGEGVGYRGLERWLDEPQSRQ